MLVRNLSYNARGTIDCEIEHPVLGWIPFTASPDDVEERGRSIHAAAIVGEYGEIAAYVEPVFTYTAQQIEQMRLRAYADPLTGSDRYFAEATREALLGNIAAAEAAQAAGLARYAEIQAAYPWPASA
jgi:hypothetical protein